MAKLTKRFVEGVSAVEQMLFARYHMTAQVYRHKVRRITDAMIIEGVRTATQDGFSDARLLYQYDPNDLDTFLQRYLESDDGRLLRMMCTTNESVHGKELFIRLTERRLLKEVLDVDIPTLFNDAVKRDRFIRDLTDASRLQSIREKVALALGQPWQLVIIDYRSQDNPTYREPGSRITPKDILVKSDDGSRQLFTEVSQPFKNPLEDKREFVAVYCPVDEPDRSKRKEQERSQGDVAKEAMVSMYK